MHRPYLTWFSGDMDPNEDTTGLRGRRRWLRRALLLGAVSLLVVFLGGLSETRLLTEPAAFVFLASIAALLVAEIAVVLGRCPRCRRLFHVGGFPPALFARACVHCGLPLEPPAPLEATMDMRSWPPRAS